MATLKVTGIVVLSRDKWEDENLVGIEERPESDLYAPHGRPRRTHSLVTGLEIRVTSAFIIS